MIKKVIDDLLSANNFAQLPDEKKQSLAASFHCVFIFASPPQMAKCKPHYKAVDIQNMLKNIWV